MTNAEIKDWDSYPGVLDIGARYKALAFLRSCLPRPAIRSRRSPTEKVFSLFNYNGKKIRPLDEDDIPLVAQIRNARRYLPSFLEHYRKLGVTRFIFIDDRSTDGSLSYLEKLLDVDIYQSHLNYMESNRGILFKEEVVQIYGTNRWWVFVDIDEYLTYDGIERHGLSDLIDVLERRRLTRMLAPLLDMYPTSNIQQAHFDGSDSKMPWEVASAFDRSGYFIRFRGKDWEIRGGVRHRVFGNWVELAKYPLMYVTDGDYFRSIHYPRPHYGNSTPVLGNLLHFKFFNDYEDSIRKAVQEGRYFEGSKHYKVALERIEQGQAVFYNKNISEEFNGAKGLAEIGFFKSIF